MRLGISTYSLPWTVAQHSRYEMMEMLLELAKKNSLEFVQVGDNLPLHELTEEELMRLKKLAETCSVNIEVGTRGLSESNILLYLGIAKVFGSPFLRVVIDDMSFHPSEQEVTGIIRKLLPELKKESIILGIENHDRFPAASLERIIRSTDPAYVAICLDTANSIGAGEGIATVMDILGPYTINLHVKDILIERVPHKMGFNVRGCAAGKGMIDIPALINQLLHYKKCLTATLEIWSDPEPTNAATLAREQQWFDESIDYLKKIIGQAGLY
jgi:sugar phosphate isomerase/epimerase